MTSDARSTFNTLPRTLCLAVALTIAPLTIAPVFAQTAMAADAHNDAHQHDHRPLELVVAVLLRPSPRPPLVQPFP